MSLLNHKEPSKMVLESFGARSEPKRLPGGEGNTFLADGIIFKKSFNDDEVIWIAKHYSEIKQNGFRIARPIVSKNGGLIIDSWTAQENLEGKEIAGRWEEKVQISQNLHKALKNFPMPNFVHERQDSYAVANRMAWGELPLEIHPKLQQYIDRLLPFLRPITLTPQLVHGDLTGNILFADGKDPAIIDFSLYWRPAEFAAAVIIVDALSWEGADESVIALVSDMREYEQMLVRAEIWRILQKGTLLKMHGIDKLGNVDNHSRAIDIIAKLFK